LIPAAPRLLAGAPAPAGAYDVDIIILALGRPAETEAAIRSALAQTGASRHVIVLDQGSDAPTLARLTALMAGRTDAALFAAGANLGVAGGRNVATALGRGRIIVGLDNDAEFTDPATLSRAIAVLNADTALGAIGFRILADTSGTDDLSAWGYPEALRARSAARFDAATFVGAGHAIRRAAWEDAGGYDPALFFTWEEFDFCLRAIDRGWAVRYCGDIAVRHKAAPAQRVGWAGRRWFHFVRNRLYIARKWGASWPGLAPRCTGYLVKGARHGLLRQTLAALLAAIRMPAGAPRPLSPAARAWLARTDAAPRGGPLRRLRQEVFAPLPPDQPRR